MYQPKNRILNRRSKRRQREFDFVLFSCVFTLSFVTLLIVGELWRASATFAAIGIK
jgi:hypothetical protein